MYSEELAMWSEVLYITYGTSSHEETRDNITFAQFEEGGLVENERNAEEDEQNLGSIYESSMYNDSDDGYISTNYIEDIWDWSQIHPYINTRDTKFKYVTILSKRKIIRKELSSQHRVREKVYIKYLSLL